MTPNRWKRIEGLYHSALRRPSGERRAQYAAMLLARGAAGDRERALELARQALDAAQEMGMMKLVEDCMVLKAQAQGGD